MFHNDKKGQFIKNIRILSTCAPNSNPSKYTNQKLIGQGVDKSTVIAGALNRLLSGSERTSSQKICKVIKT